MSTFEPMSEEEIRGWLGSVHSGVERLAKTALHHLARAKATEEARGALADRIETLQDELSRSRAFSRGLSANVVAAEEARDLAIAEQNEAYRQRDELGREGDTAHALLNGSIGSRVVPRKGETALVSQARTAAEVVADLRLQLRAIDDARTILGARPDEMLSDAAQRAAHDARGIRAAREHLEPLVSDPSGDIEDLAVMVAHRIAHTVSPTDDRDLRQILRARDGESLKDAARRVAAAEAEPAQTFRPPISVKIHSVGGVYVCAELDVGDITDPAFLALSGNEYARLALVVTRE